MQTDMLPSWDFCFRLVVFNLFHAATHLFKFMRMAASVRETRAIYK